MNKFGLFLFGFLFYCFGKSHGQDVPGYLQPKYLYISHSDSIQSNGNVNHKKILKQFKKWGLIWIDSGTYAAETQMGYDTIMNMTRSIGSNGFFILATEVSNFEYKEFQQSNNVPSYFPDTNVWIDPIMIQTHPFVTYYYQHVAYSNFPVVGVNQWQASAFCKWKGEQMNQWLAEKGITDYEIEVRLPSETEFLLTYYSLYPRWLSSSKNKCLTSTLQASSLSYVLGCNGYRANFGHITSNRLADLKLLPFGNYSLGHTLVQTYGYPNVFGTYNLLGNVAEWTSTDCKNVLFNTEEYYAGMNGKIFKQQYKIIDSTRLNQYLFRPEDMQRHFVIKGGSWEDDIYYLQPAAIRIGNEYSSFKDVGFRYVIHVKAKSTQH